MKKWFLCKILKWHAWTCNAEKGIPPTQDQMKSEVGFKEYARMYCAHCGKVSDLSKEWEAQP